MARSAVVRSDRAAPPGPKRTAAQRINGRRKASSVRGESGMAPRPLIGPAKTTMPTARSVPARNTASACRARDAPCNQADPAVITATRAGTSVTAVSTLEKSRVRQTSQYGSPRSVITTAASANEEAKGARSTTMTMNTTTRRSVSKRTGASLHQRIPAAARRASLQLVIKSESTRESGHAIPSSAARWAGKAASR
jgi:hypothetical protein